MEKNNNNLNVPNLRFPEFDGEWETHRLGELVEIKSGVSPTGIIDENGLFPFYKVEQLNNCYVELNETPYLTMQSSVPVHSIIFPKRGAAIMTNKIRIASKPCQLDTNLMALIIENNEKVDYKFLFYFIARYNLSKIADTSTIPQINNIHINPLKITLPSIKEQQKISALLTVLDLKIDTQRKIIEKYESLIRGLCEQLTRQGTKNKAINECLDCHTSTLQESSVSGTGEYPVYGATGVCGYTNFNDVKDDGILIIKDGASVGTTYYARGSYSHIGTLNRLTARKGVNLRYVYYCLKVMNFAPYKTGLAIPHIYFKDYGKHRIWCPSYEEQLQIANILTQIDDKINVEKSLLEQLNSQKRYMLGKLFI